MKVREGGGLHTLTATAGLAWLEIGSSQSKEPAKEG
jgi:hypothetical protein